MTHAFRSLVAELSKLQVERGGCHEARVAAACFAFASIHHTFVQMALELRREGHEAAAGESMLGEVSLRINGATVKATRLSNRPELILEFAGFSGDVVPWDNRYLKLQVNGLSKAELEAAVEKLFDRFSSLFADESALRVREGG